jgi:hypothetical protein
MKNFSKIAVPACLILFMNTASAFGQLYGTNTFEFQYGNLPYTENKDLTTSYDQLNLFYDSDKVSVYGRFEQFLTPHNERNYFDLTQKRFQYQDEQFRVRIGNFYETIGRGLLLRSYDIPGSVYEDNFERSRYAFFRDLEGLALAFSEDWIEVKALRARPLFNLLPPNFKPDSLRRPDLVEAIQANFYLNEYVNVGGAFMRSHPNTTDNYREYGSFMLDLTPTDNLQFFSEFAFSTESSLGDLDLIGSDSDESYAWYSGINFYFDSFGGSFEYKDYSRFTLGQGFNDPPSLIKEHTYPVLNRSTHVLSTQDEQGIQAEVYYNFEDGHSITANFTAANNDFFNERSYREYFLEGYYEIDDYFSFKSFLDYANDEIKGEEDRISVGVIADKSFDYEYGFVVDLQFQRFDRPFDPDPSQNYYASLGFNYGYDFTIAAVFEASTDLQLTDNPGTFETETDMRTWLGFNSSYKVNSSNTIEVFVGKRRGGPACTSGICYEILDFEGAELRFTTRF